MRRILGTVALSVLALSAANAQADTFETGSLIIPMDTTYQDNGMLRAYGLVYELLRNDVPVDWTIRSGKTHLGADFVASATDVQSNAAVASHPYRGGPWVIDSANATKAMPVITAWQTANPTVKVHRATAPFTADVSRRLVIAPNIAMHADGNEKIARSYLQAAGIPDSTLSTAWAATSPDMLTPAEVAGATTTNHHDGKLFDGDGAPVYCQFMSMHWAVTDARKSPETVAEVREFLKFQTHFFAECQAVSAFENDLVNGLFVTTKGFTFGNTPGKNVDFFNDDSPFAQLDGAFESTGGSEPSFTLATGGAYKAGGIVMITEAGGVAEGLNDVWMTGYLDGACPPDAESCGTIGKVSYLGGHDYDVALPISKNPKTQGTRLFLNALFEAPCATSSGQPRVGLFKSAPQTTTTDTVTYSINYGNGGDGTALAVSLKDTIPTGSTFVSATGGGTFVSGVISWNLGNLGPNEGGSVMFTVKLPSFGTYQNTAHATYRVGLNNRSADSNTTSTLYDKDTDKDGVLDPVDICPAHPNPAQNLMTDIDSCGKCGTTCIAANGYPVCNLGTCEIGACDPAHTDCDGKYANGCEYANADFSSDPKNCGACGQACAFSHAGALCVNSNCAPGACVGGFSNCDGLPDDGCEYDNSSFQIDPNHCGNCTTKCAPGFVCTAGSCVANNCPSGFSDCNKQSGDGCEYANAGFQTDSNNCGACGLACAPANATGACVAAACTIGSCNGGFADCNALAGDGCEYAVSGFQDDPANCGGCGQACAPANGTGVCTAGACSITVCDAGFVDCNALASDGCEHATAGLQTDPANCGGCGKVCAVDNATAGCSAGSCTVAACTTGFIDLDKDATNGCEYQCSPVGSADATCDGVDDDCNGTADDGYVPTQCGVGACVASSTCVSGGESCNPASTSSEGPALDPTCSDGADNDCDGETDTADADCSTTTGTGGATGAGGASSTGGSSTTAGGTGNDGGVAGDSGTGTGGNGQAGTGSDGGSSGGASGSGASTGAGGATGTGSGAAGSGARQGNAGAAGGFGTSNGTGGATNRADSGTSGSENGAPNAADAASGDTGGCGCRVPSRAPNNGWLTVLLVAAACARFRKSKERTGCSRRAA